MSTFRDPAKEIETATDSGSPAAAGAGGGPSNQDPGTWQAGDAGMWRGILNKLSLRESGIALAFAAVFVFLSIDSSSFLTTSNLLTICELQTSVGFVALAGTLLIVSGAFDISVGAIYALTAIVAAKVAMSTDPALGFFAALVVGTAIGAANGFFVGIVRVNALIVTLATNTIVVGIAEALSNGALIQVTKPSFEHIGNAQFLGVRWSVWFVLLFAILMAFVLQRTLFGRRVYAVGGNPEAASLSGVRVGRVHVATFALSGFSAAAASILYTSQIGVADPTSGTTTLALNAIAAVVVGGTSIRGGEGAIWRTVVGVLLLGMIVDGFNLLSINPLYQEIVQGCIILTAVSLDMVARQFRGNSPRFRTLLSGRARRESGT